MGGLDVAAGEVILNEAGIPAYPYPDSAARVFQLMWRYSAHLQALYETPAALEKEISGDEPTRAATLIAIARTTGRTLLTEAESKSVLAAYGIPTIATEIATSADQAAGRFGYPVVLKLHSGTITHKTDAGGVMLASTRFMKLLPASANRTSPSCSAGDPG
jgi:acetyltransferase